MGITVIATLQFKPGEGEKFAQTFPAFADRVLKSEPGTLVYKLCRARGVADTYRVVEFYDSQESLDRHMVAIRETASSLVNVLDAPPQVDILDDVEIRSDDQRGDDEL